MPRVPKAPVVTLRTVFISLALMVVFGLLSVAPAQAADTSCQGYPETRQFIDAQAWWTPTPGKTGGDDFGHGHLGGCIPERESIGATTLDVRVLLHDNPGKVRYASLVTKTADQEYTRFKDYSIAGMTCPQGTCERWLKWTLNPAWFNYSGLQEIRYRMFIDEPDGNRMHVSLNFQAYIVNGKVAKSVTRQPYLRAKGWYTGADYCEAALKTVPLPNSPITQPWSPTWKLVWHGSRTDRPVTHASVRADADFHADPPNPGKVLYDGGPYEGPVTVNGFAPGTHKLQARSDCDDPRGSTNSGVLVVPFGVAP